MPLHSNIRIIPPDSAIRGAIIEVRHLVKNFGVGFQRAEAVGKTYRNKKLIADISRQFCGYPVAIGWGAGADVDGHVNDLPTHNSDQLCLRVWWCLEMKTADRIHVT